MTPTIDTELKSILPALSESEYNALEQSLMEEGCRDALIVWLQEDIIIDGHNRFEICTRLGIDYDITEYEFDSRHDVMLWIYDNQLARRNLTDEQRAYYSGKRYKLEKSSEQFHGNQYTISGGGQNVHHQKTAQRIAEDNNESERTIRRNEKYMEAVDAIAEHSPELKDSILSGETGASKQDIVQFAGVLKETPEIGQAAIDEMVAGNAKGFKQAVTFIRRQERTHEAQSLPEGVFNVIYADPPWEYSNSGLEGSAASHYQTMSTENICALLEDQGANIAKDAVLFLWVTNPLLEDGLKVINEWGFNYKTNITWVKPYVNKGKSGWYIQGHHELLLIATRGSGLPSWQPPSVQEIGNGEHSAKPAEFRDLIERMYPDYNYLELFARNQPPRDGWVFWGNEA